MKQFIYMNTDIINSYVSQLNGGLIVGSHTEVSDSTTQSNTENISNQGDKGTFKGNLFGLLQGGLETQDESVTDSTAIIQSQSGRELIDKIIHDNSFNQVNSYLEKENFIKTSFEGELGDYIKLKGNYEIWDLEHLLNILDDKFIKLFTEFSIGDEIEAFKNKKGKLPNNSDIKNIKKESNESMIRTRDVLELCKRILPCTKFMLMEGMFIPIDERFLRESIHSIRFKYDGEITVIGKYTGHYKKEKNNNEESCNFSDIFESIENLVEIFLEGTTNIPPKTKVLDPIALYFE